MADTPKQVRFDEGKIDGDKLRVTIPLAGDTTKPDTTAWVVVPCITGAGISNTPTRAVEDATKVSSTCHVTTASVNAKTTSNSLDIPLGFEYMNTPGDPAIAMMTTAFDDNTFLFWERTFKTVDGTTTVVREYEGQCSVHPQGADNSWEAASEGAPKTITQTVAIRRMKPTAGW